MSILTLDDAKQALRIPSSDTSADAELQNYVDGITDTIERYKREIIEKRSVTERLRLCGRSRFRLWNVPVVSIETIVSLDGATTWDVTNLDIDSETGLVDVITGPAPSGIVKATYTAGYNTVPESYRRGALVVLQHVWETQRGPGTVIGGVVGPEEMARTNPFISYTLPRKALEWLGAPRPTVG